MEPKVVFGAVSSFSSRALVRLRRRMRNGPRQRDVAARDHGDCSDQYRKPVDLNEPLRTALHQELTLAAEHVQSIWWLLEIARQHQQPVPRAALTNLDLTLRHLRQLNK